MEGCRQSDCVLLGGEVRLNLAARHATLQHVLLSRCGCESILEFTVLATALTSLNSGVSVSPF